MSPCTKIFLIKKTLFSLELILVSLESKITLRFLVIGYIKNTGLALTQFFVVQGLYFFSSQGLILAFLLFFFF
jgi:hypothetical protein